MLKQGSPRSARPTMIIARIHVCLSFSGYFWTVDVDMVDCEKRSNCFGSPSAIKQTALPRRETISAECSRNSSNSSLAIESLCAGLYFTIVVISSTL